MALIEDSELQALQNSKALIDRLAGNPKTRKRTLELLKELNPSLVIPELDAARPVEQAIGEIRKEIADLRDSKSVEQAKDHAQKQIDAGRRKLREQGYSQESIDAVEKLMQERGSVDYEATAALYEKEHAPEESISPSPWSGGPSGMLDPTAMPEENPWKQVVSLAKGTKQQQMLRKVQNDEIAKWRAENRPSLRRR